MEIKWYRNIFIVWLLTGLWHGANWNYLFWGLYYCVILVIEKIFLLKILKKLPSFLRHLYAIFLFMIGWTIFRLENVKELFYVLKTMFVIKGGNIVTSILENINITQAIPYIVIGIVLSTPLLKKMYDKYHDKNIFFCIIFDMIIYGIFILSIIKLIGTTYNPFIYFRF